MLFRSHLRTGRSIIGFWRAAPTGSTSPSDPQPFLTYRARDGPFRPLRGVRRPKRPARDPVGWRVLIDLQRPTREMGSRIALAKTKDFQGQVERFALITEADYRNVVIFPAKFDGSMPG